MLYCFQNKAIIYLIIIYLDVRLCTRAEKQRIARGDANIQNNDGLELVTMELSAAIHVQGAHWKVQECKRQRLRRRKKST